MKVFISSTFEDLQDYRRAAIEVVNHFKFVPLAMEFMGSQPGEPVRVCEKEIEECDIFVGIYAHRYGHVPKGSSTSITRQEYELAKVSGRPCLCFIVKDDFPWNPKFFERERYAELEAFLKEVKEKNVVTAFTDVSDFQAKFSTSLGKLLREMETGKKGDKGKVEHVKLEIPRQYKEWIEQFHSTLSIDQLSKKGEVVKISLPELYIHLETANPFYKPERDAEERGLIEDSAGKADDPGKEEKEKEPKETANIDIEELLGRVNCILLRGAAGMGKTTLIKHLAYTLTHDRGHMTTRDFLPVPVFLKDLWPVYEKKLKSQRDYITFEALLETYIKERKYPLKMEIIKGYLARKKALFLLDGLDEVPEHLRSHLVDIIAEFQFEHKKNIFLITGRPHGIKGKAAELFGEYLHDINPLDDEKINDFISKWFRSVLGQAVGLAEVTATDMISDIRHHEHISIFTQNPLLLTAVCVLYHDGKRLPEQRADLYERIVSNLLYKRFKDPADRDKVGRVEDCLRHLAFKMQRRNLKNIEVYEAVESAKEVFSLEEGESSSQYKKRMERLFNDIEPHCGLLNRLDTGEVEFSHLTFQEFLAAGYMIDKGIGYKDFLGNSWWEETILLYIGLISLARKKESNDLVKEILESEAEDEREQRRLNILGSKALQDMQPYKRDSTVVEIAREKLIKIIEYNAPLEDRFTAGDILGTLGDLRIKSVPGNMLLVRRGEFTRGSGKGEAYESEKPERKIYLDDYEIGKYPVTNAEYGKFIEDKGYLNENYWTEEGWNWKEEDKISEPRFWHDRRWNGANFPVVGVSWYEACAYAKWLSIKTGKEYRLPTEAEWEKAARGLDGLNYPWGNTFDKNKCNMGETGLDRTSPVGIFPGGVSPYGCFDMAGNVWEWCSDWYESGYYKASPVKNPEGPKHGSSRVLRGGSWGGAAGGCRASCRGDDDPAHRWHSYGFRLAGSL